MGELESKKERWPIRCPGGKRVGEQASDQVKEWSGLGVINMGAQANG